MIKLREGDVLRYQPERRNNWCREGIAVVERKGDRLVALDTFWNVGDRHVLYEAELETAEVQWNLVDFRPCERGEVWRDFAPNDRREITSQHGLQRQGYVRLGAEPDLATRIANARWRWLRLSQRWNSHSGGWTLAGASWTSFRPQDTDL